MAGIYIHIPFCRHKCSYCNFFSIASSKNRDEIAEAIITETELRQDYLGEDIETIYFGGGTPSLLSSREVEKILNTFYRLFSVKNNAEITFEANPDDLNKKYLGALKTAGINRISTGIQSFSSEDLHYLERTHKAERIPALLQDIFGAGFSNISADLIFGIPGQTAVLLEKNIRQLLEFPVNHISAYALTVEPQTLLAHQIRKNKKENVSDYTASSHFMKASGILLSEGWEHYEISNYAFNGSYSRHNTNYWFQKPYLGLGPSAHSFNGDSRQWNVSSVSGYLNGIRNKKIPAEREILSRVQKFNEFIMLRLRTRWGIDMQEVAGQFGQYWHNDLLKAFRQIKNTDLIKMENNRIKLSREGFLYADGLAAELFREEL